MTNKKLNSVEKALYKNEQSIKKTIPNYKPLHPCVWIIVVLVGLFAFVFVNLFCIISFIVGLFCAAKCRFWASQIKKSQSWAYLIGFLFGLFGLLGYWIYYKKKQKS